MEEHLSQGKETACLGREESLVPSGWDFSHLSSGHMVVEVEAEEEVEVGAV